MPRRKTSTRGRLPDGRANPVDVHVGARMRLRRSLLGFSQDQLGKAIGLTFQQIQKYERGANRMGCSRLFDVARVLDVPVSYFFDDMDEKVVRQSPANVIKGADAFPSPDSNPDPRCRRQSLELVRNFHAIPEGPARDQIYLLVKDMAAQATMTAAGS